MSRPSLGLLLGAITLASLAAAWFIALAPIINSFIVMTPSAWTEADLVRHLYHFRLVQPEWVSAPPDFLRWTQAEATTRLIVVSLVWLASGAFVVRRYINAEAGN